MIKKFVCLGLMAATLFALAACNNGSAAPAPPQNAGAHIGYPGPGTSDPSRN